jgi:fucose 4-O-acetylase-like acetyltransferase
MALPRRPASQERSPYWDNARFILIVLVVFGHLCAYVQSQHPWLERINTVMLVWRMPLMAFIAGTFAHTNRPAGWFERLIARLLLPYLLLQATFGWYYHEVLHSAGEFSWLRPVHTLWFLLALFWWHTWLPWISRWPYPLILAVVVALLAGTVSGIGEKWSLSRALVFFPFFFLGHQLAWRQRSPALSWPWPGALCALLLCGGLLTAVLDHQTVLRMAQGAHAYAEIPQIPDGWGASIRLLIMAMSAILGAAMLSLVPTKRFWWTQLGERTLYIYIFHGIVLRTLNHLGLFNDLAAPLLIPVLILIPLMLAWALASNRVVQSTGWLIQGQVWWTVKGWWRRLRSQP